MEVSHISLGAAAGSNSDILSVTYVRLFAFDLLSIEQHPRLPGSFYRKGRPVKKVEMMGVVVSVDRKESHLLFKLDDGTGCIPCILWTNQHTSYFLHLKEADRQLQAGIAEFHAKQVKLGCLVGVQGKISCFRNQLQVTISSLDLEEDPNAEVFHWLRCMQLALQCYDLRCCQT